MGEGLGNYVRIEESHRALRSLQRQIAEWADRRQRLDAVDQYQTHVRVLESVLLRILGDLASVLDVIDSGRPAGAVDEECRLADRRLALVGRIWEWFRAKFDQRDNPAFRQG
jgi:hypothetical protein